MGCVDMIEESRFYREVRKFATTEPTYSANCQVIRTVPSDRHNLSAVARRAFGDATETRTILAAAGLPNVDSPLVEQDLVLPTIAYLRYLKEKCGITTAVRSVR